MHGGYSIFTLGPAVETRLMIVTYTGVHVLSAKGQLRISNLGFLSNK